MRNQPDSITQFLPGGANGVADIVVTKAYNTELKNFSKHVREKLHTAGNNMSETQLSRVAVSESATLLNHGFRSQCVHITFTSYP